RLLNSRILGDCQPVLVWSSHPAALARVDGATDVSKVGDGKAKRELGRIERREVVHDRAHCERRLGDVGAKQMQGESVTDADMKRIGEAIADDDGLVRASMIVEATHEAGEGGVAVVVTPACSGNAREACGIDAQQVKRLLARVIGRGGCGLLA